MLVDNMACCLGPGPDREIVAHHPGFSELKKALAFIDTLDTGDVLLFRGSGWSQRFIQHGTLGWWDHVGIVIRRKGRSREAYTATHKHKSKRRCAPGYCTCRCNVNEERLELLEATGSGCHVYPLEQRLVRRMKVDTIVAVRRLRSPPPGCSKWELNDRLERYIESIVGSSACPYYLLPTPQPPYSRWSPLSSLAVRTRW